MMLQHGVPVLLTEMSIVHGSEPVGVLDFTRGMWMMKKAKFELNDEF